MNATVEYQQRELLNIISSTKDEELISKILEYAKSLISTSTVNEAPCQYSVDEVKEGIRQSIQDVNVVPFEDVVKRYSFK